MGYSRDERVAEDEDHLHPWHSQPPPSSNVFHLRQETDSTTLQGAPLLSLTAPKLEKFFLWFNFNPPQRCLHFPSYTQRWGERKKCCIADFIMASRMVLLEGIFETITFYLLLLKIRKRKGEVTLLVCGWSGGFYHHPLCHFNPLLTTCPHPAIPSTPTSSKDTSFTSPPREQSANFPKWFLYLGTKESLY